MVWLVPWLVFLHVLSAIGAFGPTFAFPIIGSAGGREPQHANFASRVSLQVSHRLVTPLALSMPVTGALIIWASGLNLVAARWLLVAIVLYVILVGYALLVQQPAVAEVIRLTSTPPPPGAAPTGPPPEVAAAVRKVQRGGMLTTVLIVTIVALMVVKPRF